MWPSIEREGHLGEKEAGEAHRSRDDLIDHFFPRELLLLFPFFHVRVVSMGGGWPS